MTRTWKRIILITAVLLFAVGCAYGADRLAYQQFSSYDAETEVADIFTDGSEAFGVSGCEISDGTVKVTGGDPQFVINTYNMVFSRIHIVFKAQTKENIQLQVFYVPGGDVLSEQNSAHLEIPAGQEDAVIPVEKTMYSMLRFDFEQDVDIDRIYAGNEEFIVLDYSPNLVCLIAVFSVIFFPLCVLILVKTRKKEAISPGSKAKRKPLWVILFCNLFLSLTVLLFQPMIPLLADIRNSAFPVWSTWWIQMLVSIMATFILSAIMLPLSAKAGRIAALISLGMGISFLIQSLLFNIGWPFDMSVKWEHQVGSIMIWAWIVLFVVTTAYYYFETREKQTNVIIIAVAWLLIVIQAVNFTMLGTSADTLARSPDYLSESKYQQYIQPGNPDLINLERGIIYISMQRGMPYIIKDHFSIDIEGVYDATYQGR